MESLNVNELGAALGGSALGAIILRELWNYFKEKSKQEKIDQKQELADIKATLKSMNDTLQNLAGKWDVAWTEIVKIPEVSKDQARMGQKLISLDERLKRVEQ